MSEFLQIANAVAVAAAKLANERRAAGVTLAAEKSTITDIVTEADREVERFVTEAILDARPNDGVYGEEGVRVRGTSGVTWIVDPIDGTVNYYYGIPAYAVSIAAVHGEPERDALQDAAGVVVNAATGTVFAAAAGERATQDGREIRVNEPTPLERALVATGFGYAADRRAAQAEVLLRVLPRVRDVRRIGAAALDLAGVAAGTLDAYYEFGVRRWDIAAGAVIARAAGAAVEVRAMGDELFVLSAHPELMGPLRELVGDAGAR